ncbi:MAG: DUF4143 domain-containing protein [Propionibacteriaceae bacterium]|nr:DUF4143 domain-containing protein [Propionibacteriaceae bacterium]
MDYQTRVVDKQLKHLLTILPAIAVEGAKGVGKTASVKRLSHNVYSLDVESTRLNTQADPEIILHGDSPIFVDEWQRVPPIWDVVRRAVDDGAPPGRFLLAGSATPKDPLSIHSGAGRIVRLLMRPMSFPERGVEQPTVSFSSLLSDEETGIEGHTDIGVFEYVREIFTSGFPGIRSQLPEARPYLLDAYVDRIIDHDIPDAGGSIRRPRSLRNWLAAYAAATATTATEAAIRRAASPEEADVPSKPTSLAYKELLQRIWVLDPIQAWEPSFSHLKRLGKTPKHHLVDPGLAARLVGATPSSLIRGTGDPEFPRDGTFLGALFESLVAQTLQVLSANFGGRVAHMRTKDGDREVDFIIERSDSCFLAIEAKASPAIRPTDVVHLNWLEQKMPNRIIEKVIINTGYSAFRRPDGVAVIPLALLGP